MIATLDRMFRAEAEEKGLIFEITDGGDKRLAVDPLIVMRGLSNLTSNAIRHTTEGKVTIHASPNGQTVDFTVMNSAGPLPPEALAAVNGAAVNKQQRPEGKLGLTIIRELADMVGISLEVEVSAVNEVRFIVRVPTGED